MKHWSMVLLVVDGRLILGVEVALLLDEFVALLLEALACSVLARVQSLALVVVDGLGRRRSVQKTRNT